MGTLGCPNSKPWRFDKSSSDDMLSNRWLIKSTTNWCRKVLRICDLKLLRNNDQLELIGIWEFMKSQEEEWGVFGFLVSFEWRISRNLVRQVRRPLPPWPPLREEEYGLGNYVSSSLFYFTIANCDTLAISHKNYQFIQLFIANLGKLLVTLSTIRSHILLTFYI